MQKLLGPNPTQKKLLKKAAAAADTLGLKSGTLGTLCQTENGVTAMAYRHSPLGPLITLLSALTAWGNGIFMP